MMNMTKIFALVLCMVMAISLCACAGNGDTQGTTTAATTGANTEATTEATTEAVEKPSYKVTVVDEGGNPISNVVVQVCSDTGCNPGKTDENGVATIIVSEYLDSYHANVTAMPEGYEYATGETEYYFENGATELTITLKAVA